MYSFDMASVKVMNTWISCFASVKYVLIVKMAAIAAAVRSDLGEPTRSRLTTLLTRYSCCPCDINDLRYQGVDAEGCSDDCILRSCSTHPSLWKSSTLALQSHQVAELSVRTCVDVLSATAHSLR